MTEPAHEISISCARGSCMPRAGHRARCSCGWSSDCYAQRSDHAYPVDTQGVA